MSFTGSDPRLRPRPLDRVDAATPVVPAPTGFEPLSPARPGLAEPVQVAHCAKVIPAPQASDPVEAPLSVGAT